MLPEPGTGTNTLKSDRTPVDVQKETDRNAEVVPANTAANFRAITLHKARYLRMSVSLGVLAIIAFVAALYFGRAFFVPLLIGILASYTLNPLVCGLKRCYIPRAVGAALVLITLVGGLTWIVFSLRDDAAAMIEKLPEATRKMRQNLIDTRTGPTALQNMLEAVTQLEGATNDAKVEPGTRAVAVKASPPNAWLHDYALAQSALLFEIIAQAPIVLLLTYFLLASGTHFRRKLLDLVGASVARKDEAIRMLDEIALQIQRFLLTMLLSNALVGIGIWGAFWALGMDQALVWGVAAGVLHSIPYLGPAAVAIASGMVAFLQFGSLLQAFTVMGVTLLVAGAVGFVFMPWLQSRFAGVNAAVLFIALLFFGWLWGAWGLLLGAPLVAIAKVICDRVDSLRPIAGFLGH